MRTLARMPATTHIFRALSTIWSRRSLWPPAAWVLWQETAEALLQRGDVLGLRLVLKALAVAADPNVPDRDASTMDGIDAVITGDPRWTTHAGWARLGAQLLELTADADADVSEEAHRLLNRMRRSSSQ
jgi:hypothetical protein